MSLASIFTPKAPPTLAEAEREWRHAETTLAELEDAYAERPTADTWQAIEKARAVVDKTQLVFTGAQAREQREAEAAERRRTEEARAEVARLAKPLSAEAMRAKLAPVEARLVASIKAIVDDLETLEAAEHGYSVGVLELQAVARRAGVAEPALSYRSIGSFAYRAEQTGAEHATWRDAHAAARSPVLEAVIAAARADLDSRKVKAATAYAARALLNGLAE